MLNWEKKTPNGGEGTSPPYRVSRSWLAVVIAVNSIGLVLLVSLGILTASIHLRIENLLKQDRDSSAIIKRRLEELRVSEEELSKAIRGKNEGN